MRTTFFYAILLLLLIGKSFSQLPDSLVLAKGKGYIQSLHKASIRKAQKLFNGPEYIIYVSSEGEHPYFLSNNPIQGSVLYGGEEFHGLPILLDLEKEKLIISNPGYGSEMELVNGLVKEFTIESHCFINIQNQEKLKIGFYESLYDGKTQVLAKRSKKLSENLLANKIIRKFDSFNYYYIKSVDHFISIKSKSDLLKAFSERKKELKIFIRKNRLFTSNKELSIVQVARYLDTFNQ